MTEEKNARANVAGGEKPSPVAARTPLGEELRRYQIGDKLRALRLRKKLGLVELSRHTGLSPALLSKLETGRLFPTLPTLLRIAMVFSVDLDHFFSDPRARPICAVVRKADRMRFPEATTSGEPAYYFESLNFPVTAPRCQAYLAEFLPSSAEQARPHAHAGVEMLYVLTGKLTVTFEDSEHVLSAGDSIYFDASNPHRYGRTGRAATTALVFAVP